MLLLPFVLFGCDVEVNQLGERGEGPRLRYGDVFRFRVEAELLLEVVVDQSSLLGVTDGIREDWKAWNMSERLIQVSSLMSISRGSAGRSRRPGRAACTPR